MKQPQSCWVNLHQWEEVSIGGPSHQRYRCSRWKITSTFLHTRSGPGSNLPREPRAHPSCQEAAAPAGQGRSPSSGPRDGHGYASAGRRPCGCKSSRQNVAIGRGHSILISWHRACSHRHLLRFVPGLISCRMSETRWWRKRSAYENRVQVVRIADDVKRWRVGVYLSVPCILLQHVHEEVNVLHPPGPQGQRGCLENRKILLGLILDSRKAGRSFDTCNQILVALKP